MVLRLSLSVFWLLLAALVQAQESAALPAVKTADGVPKKAARPRVALVLSGGGARGLAHVGVFKALEKMREEIEADNRSSTVKRRGMLTRLPA
jgi:NTE family protein